MMKNLRDQSLFRQHCYINGTWSDADGGSTLAVTNPANGSEIGRVPKCGADETRRALEAAEGALPGWRALTAKERAAKMRAWYELIMANQEDLALIMTSEQGKPCFIPCVLFDSSDEVSLLIEKFQNTGQVVWLKGHISSNEYEFNGRTIRKIQVISYASSIKPV